MISAASRMLVVVMAGRGGHHGIDPDVVDVFPVCDGVGGVCLGDDAGRLTGPRIGDGRAVVPAS
jgi:hypothetical protein